MTLSAGVARFKTSALSVGSHTITAVYGGDTNFVGSQANDSSAPQVVTQDATTTAIKANANPSVFGRTVTLTAVVGAAAPGSGSPTGTATFLDGTKTLGTASLGSSLQATFSTNTLAVGSHTIQAVYSGDGNFVKSTSQNYSETVNRANAAVTITSSTHLSVYGQLISLTATISPVAPGAGTPTGTLTFMQGSSLLSTNLVVQGGQATFTIQTLGVGTHTITAAYSGDTNFVPSSGSDSSAPQVVHQDGTQTVVVTGGNVAVYGQAITLTASVRAMSPGSGVPSGSVTFMDQGNFLATAQLSGGQATANVGSFAMGSHVITASYGGDQNFTGSTSASYGESVVKASTSTTLQSSLNPSTAHTPVTLTAVVSVVSPGSGTPTGTITFMEGTIVIRRLSLDATGRATFGTSLLSVGSDTITAVYSDDDHFAASSSPAITQQVNPAPSTSTTLRSSLNPSTVHTSVTLTALVSVVAPGSGTPTGLIAFMDGTTVIGKRSLDATGRATFGTSLLSIGSHKITAVYSNATGQFAASSSPAITQQVNPAPALVVGSSSLSSAPFINLPATSSSAIPTTSPRASDTFGAQIAKAPSGLPADAVATPAAMDDYFVLSSHQPRSADRIEAGSADEINTADWLDL